MDWLNAGGSKQAVENVVSELEVLVTKFNSTYINLLNEDEFTIIINKLKKCIEVLNQMRGDIDSDATTMGRIYNKFKS